MLRLYLYARVRVPCAQLHTRPRVQRAPGLPCALFTSEGGTLSGKPRAQMRREIANVCHLFEIESEISTSSLRTQGPIATGRSVV
jgi:hypothetical protein